MSARSLLVCGYRHTDLGIFSDKDPRIPIIKQGIRNQCIRSMENGVGWFVLTGNLGFEYWVLEVLQELRKEGYDVKIATLFCFENHGENWNENNQHKLAAFKQVDFVKYSFPKYESPGQFRSYNEFLLENTSGAYVFYDPENETNLKYLYHLMVKKEGYAIDRLDFEQLNEIAENF